MEFCLVPRRSLIRGILQPPPKCDPPGKTQGFSPVPKKAVLTRGQSVQLVNRSGLFFSPAPDTLVSLKDFFSFFVSFLKQ